jgi:hypothetical protein
MTRTAWLNIREGAHYRRDAFVAGLQKCGFRIQQGAPSAPAGHLDILVTWNRYGQGHRAATEFERRKQPVIVAENGYLGSEFKGKRVYALALNHHNGAGRWPVGGPERWAAWGVELKPWRKDGETVILPQRGIGPPGVAMPLAWPREVVKLGRTRKHPGAKETGIPLEQDLAKAGRVITWGSGAAIKALTMGIPVFHAMPNWIGAPAARPLKDIKHGPKCDDAARLGMFHRLAWAQADLEEIAKGEAFSRLLFHHDLKEPR